MGVICGYVENLLAQVFYEIFLQTDFAIQSKCEDAFLM